MLIRFVFKRGEVAKRRIRGMRINQPLDRSIENPNQAGSNYDGYIMPFSVKIKSASIVR